MIDGWDLEGWANVMFGPSFHFTSLGFDFDLTSVLYSF